jgi:hypothetical protein
VVKNFRVWWAVAAVILGPFSILVGVFGPGVNAVLTIVAGDLAAVSFGLALLAGAALAGFLAFRRFSQASELHYSYSSREENAPLIETHRKVGKSLLMVCGLCATLGLVIIPTVIVHNGLTEPKVISAATKETEAPQATYKMRVAYPVAVSRAVKMLPGDLVGVERTSDGKFTTETVYVDGAWTTILPAATAGRGYVGVASLHNGVLEVCKWDGEGSGLRFGAFGNSLERAIRERVASAYGALNRVEFRLDDVYGYCKDNKPFVVVPLVESVGYAPVVTVPAGVALLTSDKTVKVFSTVGRGAVPGPVYPLSVAASQLDATRGNSDDWSLVKSGQVGYEDTGSELGDPNAGNTGQFLLQNESTLGWDYVTPLTRAGGSASIVGTAVVEADHVTRGVFNPLVVHRTPAVGSFATEVGDVFTTYADIATALATKVATVREFTPVGPQEWVATLGVSTNGLVTPAFVVKVTPRGSCLFQTDGVTLIRCGAAGSSQPVPVQGGGVGPSTANLSSMSDVELLNLAQQALVELGKRKSGK